MNHRLALLSSLALLCAVSPRPALAGDPRAYGNHLQCMAELGACPSYRPGGLATEDEIRRYDRECRSRSGYRGPSVSWVPSEVCASGGNLGRANKEVIEDIRDEAAPNDLEALARLFEDPRLFDDGTPQGRLEAILEATESPSLPGYQKGIRFGENGFRAEFHDPHVASNNQVGHFLTAVGMAYNPGLVRRPIKLIFDIRSLLNAPAGMSDSEVLERLIIGQEKVTSRPNGSGPLARLQVYQDKFNSVTARDLMLFRRAVRALGESSVVDLHAAAEILEGISIDETIPGSSYADLLLSAVGWKLGRWIRDGVFVSGDQIAGWLRLNLGER